MRTADVIAALARGRPLDRGSAPWTLRFLDIAARQFGDDWREVVIDGEAALEIVLPRHAGEPCQGDRLALVGSEGASVRWAAQSLRAIQADYERENRSCWKRIIEAAERPFSTVILTPGPLDTRDHRTLPSRPGALYHLDGLHRLIGWAWSGRLTPGTPIAALIAGPCPYPYQGPSRYPDDAVH